MPCESRVNSKCQTHNRKAVASSELPRDNGSRRPKLLVTCYNYTSGYGNASGDRVSSHVVTFLAFRAHTLLWVYGCRSDSVLELCIIDGMKTCNSTEWGWAGDARVSRRHLPCNAADIDISCKDAGPGAGGAECELLAGVANARVVL
jgi:hypothetical protein